MRERVYRLGRGPRQHIGVEFGVSQAARTAKSQVNNGVLRWEVEVEYGAPGIFPLTMGIGREDGHDRAGCFVVALSLIRGEIEIRHSSKHTSKTW